MAEKEGAVSLWVGQVKNKEELEDYLTFGFTDDGDEIPPPMCDDFRFGSFDEDFREAAMVQPASRKLADAIARCSYPEQVVPRFLELCGEELPQEVNAVVLLYNFAYSGKVKAVNNDSIQLTFLGTTSYR